MNEPPQVDEAQIRTEIATLREAPYAVNESEADRSARREALYKRLYPESAPAEAARADPATLALPEGLPWDREAVAGAFDQAAREGIPRHEVSGFTATIAQAAADANTTKTRWTPALLAEHMRKTYGAAGWDGEQGVNVRSGEALAVLGPKIRAALARTGLLYHPLVVERLAGSIYDHAFDTRAPRGVARLKERYE